MIFSLVMPFIFSEEVKEWVVGADKFVYAKGQIENSVTSGIAESVPKSILEGINKTIERNIKSDEELERTRYDLRTKRQSLYLQLSSEYKKRDSLFLSYSGKKLQQELVEENKKIEDIKNQIDENIQKLKDAEEKLSIKSENEEKNKIINNDRAEVKSENIKIYNKDSEKLVSLSEECKKRGYESSFCEKEIYGKGINSLITGTISSYGDYLSVSVDLYLYPGAKKIGSVMEIGSFNDLELITSSLVNQLIPLMTNSMPVTIIFSVKPEGALEEARIFLDDVLQKTTDNKLLINSGVHTVKLMADGYKSLSTSYYFEGNKKYNIDMNLEPKNEGTAIISLKKPLLGNIYVNGVLSEKIDDKKSKIVINGNNVLGQFISEDGKTAFFYIPEKLYYDGNSVTINPKAEDRGEKIDKRRRWMYGAYSAFMASLIPTFITKGVFENKSQQYTDGHLDRKAALGWQTASNVCVGVTIGLGIFWGFELVRYLLAANSVLPEKAKQINLIDLENNEINNEDLIEAEIIEEKKIEESKENISLETENGDNK